MRHLNPYTQNHTLCTSTAEKTLKSFIRHNQRLARSKVSDKVFVLKRNITYVYVLVCIHIICRNSRQVHRHFVKITCSADKELGVLSGFPGIFGKSRDLTGRE
jgi:hypothetical protein